MLLPSRRVDDADVIRARLRALLAQDGAAPPGWLPGDDLSDEVAAVEDAHRSVPLDPPDEDELPPGLGRHRAPGTATRWDPGRRGARALWAAAVLTVAVVLGWTWLQRPVVEPAPVPAPGAEEPAPSASPSPPVGGAAERSSTVIVSVVGQVARPGLVTLEGGSRVADAVDAAGGFLPGADPASVNLAAPVSDGEQVAVGVPGVATPAGPDSGGGPGGAGGAVDLNTAGVAELDALPGIGPVLAQRIVDHRTRNGPFRSVEELDEVPGIGPAIATALAELVTP